MSEQVFDFGKMLWFEDIWRDREERVYQEFFGPLPKTVLPLRPEALRAILGPDTSLEESWLHFAVIEFAPNEKHSDWLYVTSAFSQPWKIEDPAQLDRNNYSGAGFEIVLRTPERAGWAVDVLHRLSAYQIGVYFEKLKGKLFTYHDWMPLNGPISSQYPDSKVRGMFITRPQDYPARFELRSGQVDFLQIVGITGDELAYGIFKTMPRLEKQLYEKGAAPTTNPARSSIELPEQYHLPEYLAERF
ncbi:MAG TPA: suppressor of fused domain protein [Chloroflexia bacterium]|nr:suppressor of fused domain protein [Chloroflexia bacterium]